MSRVEDDREAARVAEKLMLQKQQHERKTRDKDAGESAFAKLLNQGQSERSQTQAKKGETTQHAANRMYAEAMEHAADEVALLKREQGKDSQAQSTSRQTGQAFNDKLQSSQSAEGRQVSESRAGDQTAEGMAVAGRAEDHGAAQGTSQGRSQDARVTEERLEERGESSHQSGLGASARGKGDLKAEKDGGGGGQQSGGDKKEGGDGMNPSFRLNPALMAPVPVAKPKDTGASSRLRALANEIAQKIVERARVGTNAVGQAEFQIDLRSNVLAGLSIKVSGGNGRIKAVFSGNDREVLKMLEEQKDGLKSALAGRGMRLEELKIDYRA
jgi:hypothetical protein